MVSEVICQRAEARLSNGVRVLPNGRIFTQEDKAKLVSFIEILMEIDQKLKKKKAKQNEQ